MDQEKTNRVNTLSESPSSKPLLDKPVNRRQVIKYGVVGAAAVAGVGSMAYYVLRSAQKERTASIFKNDAPRGELWELWKKRGWVKEAAHYLQLGRNVQCHVCPNECLLEPEDRSCCRNKVNKEGRLYTLAYANPCSFHVDPIEKKPLFHFLPSTGVFSIATSGCSLRCLNCQNWEISQKKPEETKDPHGDELRLDPKRVDSLTMRDVARLSMFPEDVAELADFSHSQSIAYTYSEPTSFYEYMLDCSRLARSRGIKNVWVTNGYIQREALGGLCNYLDAANVDLKSFSEDTYESLNAGKLEPILDTLKTLKERGVWFEVTNLVVPTYTDKLGMIQRMCDWLLENIGPDYPLHFSRFHPQYKLEHLPMTPAGILTDARGLALETGLHYVYIGNVPGVPEGETTFCPNCKKPVVERTLFFVRSTSLEDGKCKSCGTKIAGVWAA